MFHDLKKAWNDIIYNSTFEADHYSQTVNIPMKYFEMWGMIPQEYNQKYHQAR